MSSGLQYMAKA